MDLKGSLVNTYIRIYPSKKLLNFINSITVTDDMPTNILKLIKKDTEVKHKSIVVKEVYLNDVDNENINKIKAATKKGHESKNKDPNEEQENFEMIEDMQNVNNAENNNKKMESQQDDVITSSFFLYTNDLDWIYAQIIKRKKEGEKNVPYLHDLFEGSQIKLPENEVIKRNPILEARCVKLRAQQEAREYRKMTKTVDNVRMRFPEDSISYQMKQLNRQLIAIGQFIISIFAGFLFGFRGVEWMVGNLDFGFRLLLGVLCALIIALAEIYFLAKKLNEELNVPETVQLGGPSKFVNEPYFGYKSNTADTKKEHQD